MLGEKLREIRLSSGLTQYEVARMLGTKQQHVSFWEQGVQRPNISLLRRMAELYKCDLVELLQSARQPKRERPISDTREMLQIINGTRIRGLRQACGMSVRELANVMGRSLQGARLLEKGAGRFTPADIVRLSELFNVSADFLFGLSDDMGKKNKPPGNAEGSFSINGD